MRTTNLKLIQTLVLSLTLLASTQVSSSLNAQQEPPPSKPDLTLQTPQNTPPTAADLQQDDPGEPLDNPDKNIEPQDNEEQGIFGISWSAWLHGSSILTGVMAVLVSLLALNRVKKQREEVLKLKSRYQNLLTRVGGIEVQIEQDRMMSKSQSAPISVAAPTYSQTPPSPPQASAIPSPLTQMAPEPPLGPAPITKASLISALNSGDRQTLRENSSAELNITSESENALAMGRTIATELEEVSGGGSYWLIFGQGEHWLFPTDRTLRGFAAAQPSKGLFYYEQQTIAQPQLITPALLEKSGTRWIIKTMGMIAIP